MNRRQPIARKLKKPNKTWIRPFESDGGARYLQIAQQVINAVKDGVLRPGDRLPPQRELANAMGVDLTTVTRAYREVQQAGLLDAQGAGGSYISSASRDGEQIVDLSMNIPPLLDSNDFTRWMQSGLSYIQDHVGDGLLMSYRVGAGSRSDREAAAAWLKPALGEVDADRVLICAGAQSAISAIILAYSQPGDAIAAEGFTYPGFLAACRVAQRTVLPVATDNEGMVPDDLERVCKKHGPKLIYLVPTIQNPTATTMSAGRREAIHAVAARYGAGIIEDDPYWLLAGDAPPPIAVIGEQSRKAPVFYISTLSKCLAPGLRTAYVVMPKSAGLEPMLDALRAILLMTNQSAVSMASYFIRNGLAKDMLHSAKRELAQRQKLAARILPGIQQSHPHGLHVWLGLPDHIDQYRLIQASQEQGLGVAGSDAFCVQEPTSSAIRISLGGAKDQGSLVRALEKFSEILGAADGQPKRQIIV